MLAGDRARESRRNRPPGPLVSRHCRPPSVPTERYFRHPPDSARPRHRLASHRQARTRRVRSLGPQCGGWAKAWAACWPAPPAPSTVAPGAVLLYALLAVLLWPADREPPAASVAWPARRSVTPGVRSASRLAVWLGLAGLALLPASRAPQAISDMIAGTAPGEPAWLAWIDNHAARALARHGLPPRSCSPPCSAPLMRPRHAYLRAARAGAARGHRAGPRGGHRPVAGPRPGRHPHRLAAPTRTPARCWPCSPWPTGPLPTPAGQLPRSAAAPPRQRRSPPAGEA